jgi:transglutaminase-like putative cysteine protease
MKNWLDEAVSKHPLIVKRYKQRYVKMATPKYKAEFLNFATHELKDSFLGLDWKQLLDWEHRHLKYTKQQLPKPRAELPIDIIKQSQGRCGEFALLYTGLLLANGCQTRLILDCSVLRDKSKKTAGDHVWVEISVDGFWVHVDPTERRINEPLMYALEWKKDMNLILAVTESQIVEVTNTYQPKF